MQIEERINKHFTSIVWYLQGKGCILLTMVETTVQYTSTEQFSIGDLMMKNAYDFREVVALYGPCLPTTDQTMIWSKFNFKSSFLIDLN